MSNSRNDDVIMSVFVRMFVVILFYFSVIGGLSSPKEFWWCFKKVLRVFEVSTKCQGCFQEVSRVFQGYFKIVARVIQGWLKGVSREIYVDFKGIWKGISGKFKRYFKSVSRTVVKESVKCVSAKIKSFKGVSRIFQWQDLVFSVKL